MSEPVVLALPFRPATPQRARVRAVYLEGQVDLRAFRDRHPGYPVLAADPLIIEPVRGSFAVITKFGAVVFWNCSEETQRELLGQVGRLAGASDGAARAALLDEALEVIVGAPESAVTFNEVSLRELSLPRMSIISLAVAQSVALDHLEQEVAAAVGQFEPVVAGLHATGRLHLPVRRVLRAVGFSLEVRSRVLANLTLFDKPPETWESEILERLDNQLYDFFDLEERLSAINQKVAYFTDMSSMMMDLLNQRRSEHLELAIIALIALEIVIFVWSILRGAIP